MTNVRSFLVLAILGCSLSSAFPGYAQGASMLPQKLAQASSNERAPAFDPAATAIVQAAVRGDLAALQKFRAQGFSFDVTDSVNLKEYYDDKVANYTQDSVVATPLMAIVLTLCGRVDQGLLLPWNSSSTSEYVNCFDYLLNQGASLTIPSVYQHKYRNNQWTYSTTIFPTSIIQKSIVSLNSTFGVTIGVEDGDSLDTSEKGISGELEAVLLKKVTSLYQAERERQDVAAKREADQEAQREAARLAQIEAEREREAARVAARREEQRQQREALERQAAEEARLRDVANARARAEEVAAERAEKKQQELQNRAWDDFLQALIKGNKSSAARIAKNLDISVGTKRLIGIFGLRSNISSKVGKFACISVRFDSDAPGGVLAITQIPEDQRQFLTGVLGLAQIPEDQRVFLKGAQHNSYVSGETFFLVGRITGVYKYDTVLGGTNTVPSIKAEYVFR